LDAVIFLEQEYNCTGICKTPIFFYDLELSKGMALFDDEKCLLKVQEMTVESAGLTAIILLIVEIFMIAIWCVQYCLWIKYND